MGFYNVANGDVAYLTELANKYTLNGEDVEARVIFEGFRVARSLTP
jgi:hypothetical protein